MRTPSTSTRAAELVRDVLGDEVYVTCSADILPEIREYERTSTAVVNAYVGPAVTRLHRLADREARGGRDHGAAARSCSRAAATMSPAAALKRPAYLVESGPAAGVIACAHLARLTGLGRT